MSTKLKSEEKKEDETASPTSSPSSQQVDEYSMVLVELCLWVVGSFFIRAPSSSICGYQTRVTRHRSYPIPASASAASAAAAGGGGGESASAASQQDPKFKPQVTMVVWSCDDTLVATAVNDFSIKIWNTHSGSRWSF